MRYTVERTSPLMSVPALLPEAERQPDGSYAIELSNQELHDLPKRLGANVEQDGNRLTIVMHDDAVE